MWHRNAVAGLLAAVAATATDGAYLALIRSQNATPPNAGVVPFLVTYIAAVAVAGVLSAGLILQERRTLAKTLLVSAALGFIAIFSIGLGLLITAGLFGVAALGLAPSAARIAPLLAALTAVGLVIAGFTITGVFWGS